jgi:ABC-type branched-subunit amino acid transport system ATPase component
MRSTSAVANCLHNDVKIPPIIGPNGAGKSTLLRAIYGLHRYFNGTAHFRGHSLERLLPKEQLKLGACSCRV